MNAACHFTQPRRGTCPVQEGSVGLLRMAAAASAWDWPSVGSRRELKLTAGDLLHSFSFLRSSGAPLALKYFCPTLVLTQNVFVLCIIPNCTTLFVYFCFFYYMVWGGANIGISSFSPPCGLKDCTQAVRGGSKCPYLLSHLASPLFIFKPFCFLGLDR